MNRIFVTLPAIQIILMHTNHNIMQNEQNEYTKIGTTITTVIIAIMALTFLIIAL